MPQYRPYSRALDTCAYVCGLAGIIILALFGPYIISHVRPCLFHIITGYYCPGCGGTRSLVYMLSGHFIKSFYYHPLVLYVALPGVFFMLSQTIYRIRRRACKTSSPENTSLCALTIRPWYIYTACVVLILQWIIKNLLLFAFDYSIIR